MIDQEFLEAADDLVSAYRVVRKLAGRAILERIGLSVKIQRVRKVIEDARLHGGDLNLLIADLEEALDDPPPVV